MKKIYVYALIIGIIALSIILFFFDFFFVFPLIFLVPCVFRNLNQNQRTRRARSERTFQSSNSDQNDFYPEQSSTHKNARDKVQSVKTSKFCSNCGVKVIKKNLRFCEACGSKL